MRVWCWSWILFVFFLPFLCRFCGFPSIFLNLLKLAKMVEKLAPTFLLLIRLSSIVSSWCVWGFLLQVFVFCWRSFYFVVAAKLAMILITLALAKVARFEMNTCRLFVIVVRSLGFFCFFFFCGQFIFEIGDRFRLNLIRFWYFLFSTGRNSYSGNSFKIQKIVNFVRLPWSGS